MNLISIPWMRTRVAGMNVVLLRPWIIRRDNVARFAVALESQNFERTFQLFDGYARLFCNLTSYFNLQAFTREQ